MLRAAKHGTLWLYRVTTVALVVVAFLVGSSVLLLRYWVLPGVGAYRAEIAAAISRAAHQRIEIGSVEGRWDGLRPRLTIRDLRIYDRADAQRLHLAAVDGTLAWSSLLGEVRFYAIEVDRLAIEVRRDERGGFHIAGIPLHPGGRDRGFGDWLLEQHRITVRESSLTWIDETLGGLPLKLSQVELSVYKHRGGWRVGMQAAPPLEVAAPVDLRGELRRGRSGTPDDWGGRVYLGFNYADLAALRQWLPLPPDLLRGAGGMEVWADLNGGRLAAALADVRLSDLSLRLRSDLPYLDLVRMSGRLTWRQTGYQLAWSARNLTFATPDGLILPPADLSYRRDGPPEDPATRSEVRFDTVDLAAAMRLLERLPLDQALRQRVAEMNPRGTLRGFEVHWTGPLEARTDYALKGGFESVSVAPSGFLPGFSTVSGAVDVDRDGGEIELRANGSQLDMPLVFAGPLPLDELAARVTWAAQPDGLLVRVDSLEFANQHLAGRASGSYRPLPGKPGVIDLAGSLDRGDGSQAWRYLPLKFNAKLRGWAERAVVAAQASDVRFRVSGDLSEFPFHSEGGGVFEVTTRFSDGVLAYGTSWPALEGLRGELAFRGTRMTVRADEGRMFGVRLRSAEAVIEDLDVPNAVCTVRGEAEGPTQDFLQFIASSPVERMIGGFTAGMQAAGPGTLALELNLPLRHMEDTTVAGRYRFAANTLEPGHGAPRVEQFTGEMRFDNRSVRLQQASARVLRMPVRFTAERAPGARALVIRGSGRADGAALQALIGRPWAQALDGITDWTGVLRIEGGGYDLSIASDLHGLTSKLPAPLAKAAGTRLPFRLERRPAPGQQDLTIATAANLLSAQWLQAKGAPAPARAEIRLNESAPAPRRDGVWVAGQVAVLDFDRWQALLSESNGVQDASGGGVSLQAQQALAYGRRWHDVSLEATYTDAAWQAQVSAREAAGDIEWRTAGTPAIVARFSRLHLPPTLPRVEAPEEAGAGSGMLPALDVRVEDFRAGERDFGRLTLLGVADGSNWRIEQLELRSPEGNLKASGVWQRGTVPITRLEVAAEADDIGAYFARLQLPKGVEGGHGRLNGQLAWNGTPQAVDLPSLSGSLRVEAKDGRFVKIEPGLSKLIGVISLQALPRRVALDFRDVFSEGFAFDRINGRARIERGVARTGDFSMAGPAARVEMKGEVNLAGETQRLDVKVMPSMSEGVALGAAIVNPAAGIAALLAQKALKDPIGQMMAFEYEVSGTWDDPLVMKKRRDNDEGRRGRK